MTLSELRLERQCQNINGENDCADFFTINSRYSGYTRDRALWHVLDSQQNAYISYLSDELDEKLRNNFFENGNNGNTQNQNQISKSELNMQWIYIGLGVLALIGLAVWGAKQ